MSYHERNVRPPKLVKMVNFVDTYGNSLALYTLLLLITIGIWLVSPIPSPNWTVNGKMMGWASVVMISVTSLHGLLWVIITRQSLNLSSNTKQFLSGSIKVVKPLHMMTGMIGLGLAFIHGFAYMTFGVFNSVLIASGIVALATLLILAIDGIGLMVTPFLSRKVHRWIALTFLISLIIHLVIIFI
jgi:hypothetical protein